MLSDWIQHDYKCAYLVLSLMLRILRVHSEDVQANLSVISGIEGKVVAPASNTTASSDKLQYALPTFQLYYTVKGPDSV